MCDQDHTQGYLGSHLVVSRSHQGVSRSHLGMSGSHAKWSDQGVSRSQLGLSGSHLVASRSHPGLSRLHSGVSRLHPKWSDYIQGDQITTKGVQITPEGIQITLSWGCDLDHTWGCPDQGRPDHMLIPSRNSTRVMFYYIVNISSFILHVYWCSWLLTSLKPLKDCFQTFTIID